MKIKILLLAFILTGCVTTKGYETMLDSFNGVTETELVREWGAPQGSYEVGETKFLTYLTSRWKAALVARVGGVGISRSCQTTFKLENGRVISSTFKGRYCRK